MTRCSQWNGRSAGVTFEQTGRQQGHRRRVKDANTVGSVERGQDIDIGCLNPLTSPLFVSRPDLSHPHGDCVGRQRTTKQED